MGNIKLILLITMTASFLISCDNAQNDKSTSYANENEKNIIKTMDCWNSVMAESVMDLVLYEKDKERQNEIYKESLKYRLEAKDLGRNALSNDTVFVNCIRNDSVYKSLLNERFLTAESLMKFRKSIPIYSENMEKISKQIVEYNFLNNKRLGIYTYTFRNDILSIDMTFYNTLNDLFKEAYIHSSNSKLSDNEIVIIDSLFTRIDEIDRHIWAVPYYNESKKNFETKKAALKLQQEKQKKLDDLTK